MIARLSGRSSLNRTAAARACSFSIAASRASPSASRAMTTISASADKADFRFLRFRPPLLEHEGAESPALPHIRLDRALQFLIGDKLQ